MASSKSLGDTMKNERVLRRKRHIKLLKKRTKQLKKKVKVKQHEWNFSKKERIEEKEKRMTSNVSKERNELEL